MKFNSKIMKLYFFKNLKIYQQLGPIHTLICKQNLF